MHLSLDQRFLLVLLSNNALSLYQIQGGIQMIKKFQKPTELAVNCCGFINQRKEEVLTVSSSGTFRLFTLTSYLFTNYLQEATTLMEVPNMAITSF